MNEKKFTIVVNVTNQSTFKGCFSALKMLQIPSNFTGEVMTFQSDNKYHAYNLAMKNSDAKYKIYLDEKSIVMKKDFLNDIIKIFESDKNIGVIGCSGAIQISTHGVCFNSAKRCGKILTGGGELPKLAELGQN